MAFRCLNLSPLALAAASCCLPNGTYAQTAQTTQSADAHTVVTVTGRSIGTAAVAGFGDGPLARAPIQASVVNAATLADAGIQQFSGLARLDASVGDAYNAEGYWSNLAVRGFTLDNRFNYLRDGLPINAETAIALENKERLELLKGTSGVQAGTSAPGGLLNLVVKRPNGPVHSLRFETRQGGSVLGALDLSQRFGGEGALGVRVNVAWESMRPQVKNTAGERSLAALALDLQVGSSMLVQFEAERSRQTQPSVAGYSLVGDQVPDVRIINPALNLNDQPWRQPVVLNGETASLRLQQRLGENWRLTVHALQQNLKSDDRTAFPFGVFDANTYGCERWCDRFAPDGSFTYWQYVSDNERRNSSAATVFFSGQVQTGTVRHGIELGVLRTQYRARFQDQVFDIAGTGRIDGSAITPPSPGFPDANTNRDEDSTEWFVRDAVQISPQWQLWLGARHSQMQRRSARTSADSGGSLRATQLERQTNTPWLAIAHALGPKTTLYASWGKGLESDVAPNRPRYSNAGESLLLNSRQWELGLKHGTDQVEAALTWFDIAREQTADIGACDGADTCRRQLDGQARHRGLEAQWSQELGAWSWQASMLWLHARREGSQQAGVNGLRPPNVSDKSLRVGTEYRSAPGLAVQANLVAEGRRSVLPYDDTVQIGGWTRLDLGARWRHTVHIASQPTLLTWRLGLDNSTNRRAWKESPYQFGHVYLYPLPQRTWRVSLQAAV